MRRAINSLTVTPDLLLIDGNRVPPKLTIEAYPIIKGGQVYLRDIRSFDSGQGNKRCSYENIR